MANKKILFLIMCTVIISVLSNMLYSQTVDYTNVNETLLNLNINSAFTIEPNGSDPTIDSATVTMELFPVTDYRQELVSMQTGGVENNSQVIFSYKNPAISTYEFSYHAQVLVKNVFMPISQKIPFPLPQEYQYANTEYTSATEYMDFDTDPLVRTTAAQIASGQNDLYVVVYKLSKWVTDNVNYDLSVAGKVHKASDTIRTKVGVCDDATVLFIAMARSLGIPTKYVTGVAYTNLNNIDDWGAHAWAEVYFQGYGWVPFDFTYQQYGFVDASHIKLKDSGDANEPSVKYEWFGHDAQLITQDLTINTYPVSITGQKENPISISVRPIHSKTGPLSYNAVEATVTNLKNNYFTTNVYLSKAPSIVGTNNQVILLKPLEVKKIYWIIYSNITIDDPQKYYIYTIESSSLDVSNDGNYTVNANAVVYSQSDIQTEIDDLNKEGQMQQNTNLDFSCSNKNSFYDYEPVLVDCNITNNNVAQNNLQLCLGNDCETFSLGPEGKKDKEFSFFENESKAYSVQATLENNNIYKVIPVEFEVVPKPNLNISVISKPTTIDYDSWYGIEFMIDDTSTVYDANVTFQINDYSQSWHVDTFDVPREYKMTLKADNVKSGNNTFNIYVSYHDTNGVEYNEEYSDSITVNNLKFFQWLKYYLVQFVTGFEKISGGS